MKTALKKILLGGLFASALTAQSLSVVNGARFELKYPVSPGSYAQAYGAFTEVTATSATTIPLPTTLGGVQVFVNDVAAPLYGVSPTAVSFLVPSATAIGRASVRVVHSGGRIW